MSDPVTVIREDRVHELDWREHMPLMALLWHSRRRLLRIAATGLALSTLFAFLIPKQYESTVELMPPDPQTSSSTLALLMGGIANPALTGITGSLFNPRTPGSVFVGILQSRTVADDIINRFDLRKAYGYKRYTETRKKLARRTDISEDKKTAIITLTVTDNDPVRARDIARMYVDELDKLVAQLSTGSAHRERAFLEERLQAIRRDLDSSTKELAEFSSKNGAIDIQAQSKAMLEAGARAQGELIAAQAELRGLEQIYAPESVKIQAARARIGELQRQIQKMSGTGEGGSGGVSDDLYPPLRKLPLLSVTYYDLYRRAKIQEAVFEALTKQYEIAKVQEAREIPSVKVLDMPQVPEKKAFPPRLLLILLGTLTFISGAIGWIAFQRWWIDSDGVDPRRAFAGEVWTSTHRARVLRWKIRRSDG